MNFFESYGIVAGVILSMMILLWLLSLVLKNASIVDIFWGAGFVVTNWVYFFLTPEGYPVRKLLISLLVTIWGLRLSMHILKRNWGKEEDYRYQSWRAQARNHWWWRSLFKVFILQGILMWIISAPLLAAQYSPNPNQLTMVDYLAIVVWVIGFFFEAVGDWQLVRFRLNPDNKGKLLTSGVWKYTRHPNYFGDAAQWWGFFFLAISTFGGILTIFSPVIMTLLLRFVSGVTLLEKDLKTSKPGFEEYINTTNAFIPWFPKKKAGDK